MINSRGFTKFPCSGAQLRYAAPDARQRSSISSPLPRRRRFRREAIGVPIYLIFDLQSNPTAAYGIFRLPRFDMAMKKMLDFWGHFLGDLSSKSNAVLDNGAERWFIQPAITSLDSPRTRPTLFPISELKTVGSNPGTLSSPGSSKPVPVRSTSRTRNSSSTAPDRLPRVDVKDQFSLKGQTIPLTIC